MRIKRLKRASKRLAFYKNCFDFRPPHQIIIDGTFSQCALKNKVNLEEQMPKYLGEEVKMFSTACVITELDKLGSPLYGASLIVKQFAVRRCGHEKKPISAVKCLSSLVTRKNKNHLIIATVDKSLISALRSLPEVPVITFKGNAMTLLKPAKDLVEKVPLSSSLEPEKSEIEQIKQLKSQLGMADDEETKKRKKKRPKAPNPLSCKKKKEKVTQHQETDRKRKRKRARNMPKNMAKLLEAA